MYVGSKRKTCDLVVICDDDTLKHWKLNYTRAGMLLVNLLKNLILLYDVIVYKVLQSTYFFRCAESVYRRMVESARTIPSLPLSTTEHLKKDIHRIDYIKNPRLEQSSF